MDQPDTFVPPQTANDYMTYFSEHRIPTTAFWLALGALIGHAAELEMRVEQLELDRDHAASTQLFGDLLP